MSEALPPRIATAVTREAVLLSRELQAQRIREAYRRTEKDAARRKEAALEFRERGFLVELQIQDWKTQGVCLGSPEVFYPKNGETKIQKIDRENRAKEMCGRCVVRDQCLAYALELNEQHGIWGGYNESERKQLRKQEYTSELP